MNYIKVKRENVWNERFEHLDERVRSKMKDEECTEVKHHEHHEHKHEHHEHKAHESQEHKVQENNK